MIERRSSAPKPLPYRYHPYALEETFPSAMVAVPLLTLLSIVLILLAYQAMGTIKVVVGPQDTRFISGTHELEPLEDTGRWMRWTTSESQVELPLTAAHQPLIVDISLINHYPHELADHPEVDLLLHDDLLLSFAPTRQSRHYRILLSPQERMGWGLPFTIRSSTVMPATDARDLGAVLVEARLLPTRGFPVIPPFWQIAACIIGVLAVYAALRGIGASGWVALTGGGILAVVWAVVLALLPMQIAPFTMRVAALCLLAATYGGAVALLKENQHWVSIATLPLLMGVAYWLMPIYQIVMTIDGVEHVTPYPPTLWVAGAMILAVIIGIVVLAVRGQWYLWGRGLLALFALAAMARLIIMLEFVMDNTGVAAICIIIGFGVVAASPFLRRKHLLIASGVGLLVIIGLASLFDPWLGRSGPDFWILFKGAREWFRGGSMYNIPGIIENHFGHSFKVPPFYGMLFLPFVEQDGLMILFWHRIMNMVLLAGVLYTLLRGFMLPLYSAVGAGVVMAFSMRPVADTVAYGQIDIMLLLLLALALVASQREHDGLAGAAIALATLFKLYPALLLAFFVAKRQWRALIGFAVAMLICNGIAIAVVGWELHATYVFEVIPLIRGGTSWVENQTVNGFVSRLFAPDITATIFHHPVASAITYLTFGITVLGATWLSLRPADRTSPRYALQFSLFVILLVLVVPAAWMHYETVTILAFVAVLVYTSELGLPRWAAALTGAAYALIAYGNQWSYYLGDIMGGLTVMGVSFKFYGLVMLLSVTVYGILDSTNGGE